MTRSNCASAYAMRPLSANVWSLNGSPTLVRPAVSSVGLNCGVGPQLPHGRLDGGLALGCVESLALGRREHDVEHATLLGGELLLDEVRRALRVGAGDLELVAQPASDGGDERDEDDDDPEPGKQDPAGMGRAGAGPAGPRARRQSFVG